MDVFRTEPGDPVRRRGVIKARPQPGRGGTGYEVLVGFGRCGSAFAFQDYGLEPDLVTLSKAITGGYVPFGAVWTSPRIASHYDEEVLACGLTNYGHPLGLAALEAVLDLLDEPSFNKNKTELEQSFAEWTEALTDLPNVTEVRCRGLMARVDFAHAAPSWQEAFEAGLHLFSKNNFSILAPPYISSLDRLQQAFAQFRMVASR